MNRDKTIFGFWIYLLTDFVMFAALFATYAVLDNPSLREKAFRESLSVGAAFSQMALLLTISFVSGLALLFAERHRKRPCVIAWGVTLLLGLFFLRGMGSEFQALLTHGHTWQGEGFLSAYFTLLGTFTIHVALAFLWTLLLLAPLWKGEIDEVCLRRFTCLKMFWQFLTAVWVLIFLINMGGRLT